MASSYDKSVKGGTKIKLAPPKSKYVEHILSATHAGEAGVAEVFRSLQHRVRDSTWTIVFKSLIIVHLMIRDGEPDVTLRYLAAHPRNLSVASSFTKVQTQGANIRNYSHYLVERARAYHDCKVDHVRSGEGRLKRLAVDKGLLRETESVQNQIQALLACDFLTSEPENEITLTAYKLLTMDLLVLFSVMNEATINVLEHYFEMSKPDAERSLVIYRTFARQTEIVVQFLGVSRQYEHATRLQIPRIKHAPTSLAGSLEEYLVDKDFETNRRQYLAQQDAKKAGKVDKAFGISPRPSSKPTPPSNTRANSTSQAPPKQQAKGPPPDLIDFFDSIEQNQQTMAQHPGQPSQQNPFPPQQTGTATAALFQPQSTGHQDAFPLPQSGFQGDGQMSVHPQHTGFPSGQSFPNQPNPFPIASTNPFGQPSLQQHEPLQYQPTGAGFGGYGPQPEQSFQQPFQDGVPSFQQQQAAFPGQAVSPILQQSTNPFRQPAATASSPTLLKQSTNPFARQMSPPAHISAQQTGFSQEQAQPSPFPPFQPPQQQNPLQPQPTGTNPFARTMSPSTQSPPPPQHPLQPNVTGSTNPFRKSMFVSQQTGLGWQHQNQGTIGGFSLPETQPVFPRPGQTF